VAGGGRVEDDVVKLDGAGRIAEEFRELVERGNLDRARAGELLLPDRPASASATPVAQDSEVLPTPPLPVKNR
jgi:hypothetical protein